MSGKNSFFLVNYKYADFIEINGIIIL
jgi:hypothetical protein